jgi:RNA polymerase sigma factor for flagellar operon FliA
MHHHAASLDFAEPTTAPAAWLAPAPDRDELVRQGLPLVKAIAERLRRRYTLTASFDDLCAMGMTGLAIAVDRFDATRGASFVTFAYHKIRGAILDGLRRSDRRYSFEMRCRRAAEGRAAKELAADEEVSTNEAHAGIDGATAAIASSLSHMATIHLAAVSGAGDEDTSPDLDELVHQREVRERVQEAIASLPEKEREVIALYYYCDGSFADVGARLGISRVWASRLHKRALTMLRELLAELHEEAPAASVSLPEASVDTRVAVRAKAPERARVPGLELHLVRPAHRDVRAPAFEAREGSKRVDLGGQLLAPSIAAVGHDNLDAARLGEDVGESSHSLRVEGAARRDVARLLAPVPSLVSDGVDRPFDEDQLPVGWSVPARHEDAGAGLRHQPRDVVRGPYGAEAPGVEGGWRDTDALQHLARFASVLRGAEIGGLRLSQIVGLRRQDLAIGDGLGDIPAPLLGAGDQDLERGLPVSPFVPLQEGRERAAVGRRRRVRVRPIAALGILLQPEHVASRSRHRDVVAVRLRNRCSVPAARKVGRHVDRLLEPFQQGIVYSHVASRLRPRERGGSCCLAVGTMQIRGSPKWTAPSRVARASSNRAEAP